MQGIDKLHEAEKKLFCSAPKFARSLQRGEYDYANAIMASVALGFANLAFVNEAKADQVVEELGTVLDRIDDAWAAVIKGVDDAALAAYAEAISMVPEAHKRVEALLFPGGLNADDSGSRGDEKQVLMKAANQSLSAIGLA